MVRRAPATMKAAALVGLAAIGCRDSAIASAGQKAFRRDGGTGVMDLAPRRGTTSMDLIRVALSAIDTMKTPAQAAALLAGTLISTGDKRWWDVKVSDATITVKIGAADRDEKIREIEIGLEIASGVQLRDVKTVLGEYKTVFESKTSSVRFVAPPAHGITAYADLMSSKVLPDAAVVAIILRR